MAHESTITTYHSNTTTNVPTLAVGELGVNIADRKLWVGSAGGRVSLGVFDSEVNAPRVWAGNTAGTHGVSITQAGDTAAWISAINKAESTLVPLNVRGSTATFIATAGDLTLSSTGGAVVVPGTEGLNSAAGPVKGVGGWFGGDDGARGVSVFDTGTPFFTAVVAGTTRAARTSVSCSLAVQGTALTLQSTVTTLSITAASSMSLSADTTLTLAAGSNILCNPSSLFAVRFAGQTAVNAIAVTDSEASIYKPGYSTAPAFEANTSQNKINFNGVNATGINLTSSAVLGSSPDGTVVLYWDNNIIKLISNVGEDRLILSDFLALPNLPPSRPGAVGAGGLWKDGSGYVRVG